MLQLVQAYTAIFGNGEMLKPYYIDKVVDKENDEVVYQGQKTVVGTPIKESTAKEIQALMERVVSDKSGTAKFYAVDEVNIMAKTGTSEIATNGSYGSNDSITSVMLAFPAESPKYMIYFAYVSPYDYYNHTYSTPIKNLIRRVALLTEVGYSNMDTLKTTNVVKEEMPNVLNKNINEATDILNNSYNLRVIKIGNGDTVTDQYPSNGEQVYTNSRVYLRTDGDVVLPDFTGWTKKEIVEYANFTGLNIKVNGQGICSNQSISAGTTVDKYDLIVIDLSLIDSNVSTYTKTDDIIDDEE